MIVKEEFLSKLRRYFSLNLYEVKIWAALLSRGVSTAGELSDMANVPRSRSYDVLESLEKKGFVVMNLGKPIKYVTVPPEEVVERVKKNMKIEAEEKIKRLENLKDTEVVEELKSLFNQGKDLVEPADKSGAIRGRHNIYNHLESMMRNAEKSVTMITTADGFLRKAEGLKETMESLSKRGVSVRIAAPMTKDSKKAIDLIKKFADVKHTDSNARFCIVDGKEVLFMIQDDKAVHPAYDIGIWVNTPFFGSALEQMYDVAWNSLKPIK